MDRKKKGKKAAGRGCYAVGAVSLAALVLFAFFAPRLVFRIQDNLQYNEYRFTVQEEEDITLLSTSYETSLYKRLERFAKDVQTGTEIYVTEEELTPTQEIYDFLQSENGLNQDSVLMWLNQGIAPYSMIYNSEVKEWKQYVIYSDNYAEGVNFIIWYLALEDKAGGAFHVLLDAETQDIYGICTNYDKMRENSDEKEMVSYTLSEVLGGGKMSEQDMEDAWLSIAYFYAGFQDMDIKEAAEQFKNGEYEYAYETGTDIDGYLMIPSPGRLYGEGEQGTLWEIEEDGQRMNFIFYYGDYSQTFRMEVLGDIYYLKTYYEMAADMVAGFPAIYELIPDFLFE